MRTRGRAGDDVLIGNGGADVIRGGAGDDLIAISDLMFAAIDGGTGDDTLRFDGAGMVLDLTSIPPAAIQSIERIDLSGTGPNGLIIDAQALFDLTEERASGEAILIVDGDAGDNVTALGFTANGTQTVDGITYDVYEMGGATLLVAQGVSVAISSDSGAGQAIGPLDAGEAPFVHDAVVDLMIYPDSGWLI
ncbi:hypothetical protein WJT74_00730 [Sphingomicrobium sp. XHP0239]|uniref:hypothetical protein n=1 Tax=Sphingomicrobium maritimum TaxID=3133972 RepID=UPI0031CCA569